MYCGVLVIIEPQDFIVSISTGGAHKAKIGQDLWILVDFYLFIL